MIMMPVVETIIRMDPPTTPPITGAMGNPKGKISLN